jgi:hypothetical protein
MPVPSVLPDDISGNHAQYFDGWVMSSTEGNMVEVCILEGNGASVYIYQNNELTGSYSLAAQNKRDASTLFTKLLAQRRQECTGK